MKPILQFSLIIFLFCSLATAQNKNVTAAKENHAPVFVKEMPDTTIGSQITFRFTILATDADGDKIKYGSANNLPTGAIINDSTGIFSWKPTSSQAGRYEVIITASDGKLIASSRRTTLLVIPYFISAAEIKMSCNPIPGGKTNGNSYLCNTGDTVTVKAYSNPGYRFMNWTENNVVVSKDLFYTFIVTGNRNLVANFRVNHAPVFVKEMPDTFVWAGKTLLFQYKATDPDGDSITYSAKSVLPINATFLLMTGVFSWRPFNAQRGMYELIIAASDGKLTTYSKRAILTTDFHVDFEPGTPHIAIAHNVGGEVSHSWIGDTVIVRAISNIGYRFTNWTEKGIVVSTDSVYRFVVTVSRDLLANFRVNHAPVFVKEMPDTTFGKDLFVSSYLAIDPDGDSVKYYATQLFPKMAALQPKLGTFGWRPIQLEGAMNFIQIYATDGQLKTYSRISTLYFQTYGCYYCKTLYLNVKPKNAGYAYRIIISDTINLRAVPYKEYKFHNWTYNGAIVSQDSIYTILEKNIEGGVLLDANFSEITSIQSKDKLPSEYQLSQNYPNPFNPETTIGYQLSTPGFVTLKVYDLLGREVATLVNEYKQLGNYRATFNARHLERSREIPSGIYFYRLQSGSFTETKKLVLVK